MKEGGAYGRAVNRCMVPHRDMGGSLLRFTLSNEDIYVEFYLFPEQWTLRKGETEQ